MEARKPWVPKRKQRRFIEETCVGQYLPPQTRREHVRRVQGKGMLRRAFQCLAASVGEGSRLPESPRGYERNALKDFGVKFFPSNHRLPGFEENAKLVIRGLHFYPFSKNYEPFGGLLVTKFVKQNPKKFGEMLGKDAGHFASDLGQAIETFFLSLGPDREIFLSAMGPHITAFVRGTGKHIDVIEHILKKDGVDPKTIKLLTGKR